MEENYSDSLKMMKYLSMSYRKKETVEYKQGLKDLLENKLKNMTSNQSNSMVNAKKARRKKKQYYVDNNQIIILI